MGNPPAPPFLQALIDLQGLAQAASVWGCQGPQVDLLLNEVDEEVARVLRQGQAHDAVALQNAPAPLLLCLLQIVHPHLLPPSCQVGVMTT